MTESSDVVVIGGGIAGVGAAARLSPDASVTVLETEEAIGWHSSGRTAAIYIPNYGNATLRAQRGGGASVRCSGGHLGEKPLLTARCDANCLGGGAAALWPI